MNVDLNPYSVSSKSLMKSDQKTWGRNPILLLYNSFFPREKGYHKAGFSGRGSYSGGKLLYNTGSDNNTNLKRAYTSDHLHVKKIDIGLIVFDKSHAQSLEKKYKTEKTIRSFAGNGKP